METARRETPTGLAKNVEHVDVRIARLADAQHGVVSPGQLEGLGLAANTVRARARAGRLHGGDAQERAAFERDRRRDLLLRAAGWTVIRITWRQLTKAADETLAALAAQ